MRLRPTFVYLYLCKIFCSCDVFLYPGMMAQGYSSLANWIRNCERSGTTKGSAMDEGTRPRVGLICRWTHPFPWLRNVTPLTAKAVNFPRGNHSHIQLRVIRSARITRAFKTDSYYDITPAIRLLITSAAITRQTISVFHSVLYTIVS